MRGFILYLSIAFVLLSTNLMNTLAQTDTIHIDIGGPTGVIVRPLIGFNSGIAGADAPNDAFSAEASALIADLSPSFWKVSTPYHYRIATSYGARIQFETVGYYFSYNPKPFPWHDWQSYTHAIEDAVSTSLTNNAPVFLWDIWNEPQLRSYNDPALILETYDRAYTAIKTTDPRASVTGPAFNGWIPQAMELFLDYLVTNNMQFAAFSWHEFGRPEEVVSHVEAMRGMIVARPALGSPMINIDEYQNEAQHLIPGFNLAWFYYLEQSQVDYAARACWNVQDPEQDVWNDCWRGLNGLFRYDNKTPTTIYSVYDAYVSTAGQERLAMSSSESSDTVVLASIDPVTQTITLLVGRFHSEQPTQQFARNVEIRLTDLPYPAEQAMVEISRIPNAKGQMTSSTMWKTGAPQPLLEPSILISDFQDGDVYVIILHPPLPD